MQLRKRHNENRSAPLLVTMVLLLATASLILPFDSFQTDAKATSDSTLRLIKIRPTAAKIGEKFQVQKNGESTISVMGENLTKNTIIIWGKVPLKTFFYLESNILAAIVPKSLYAKRGKYEISLLDTQTKKESNKLIFRVTKKLPPKKSTLKLVKMGPTSTKANQLFQVQPNGQSAMWIKGEGITLDTKIIWEKTPLTTHCANPTTLTAYVLKALYAKQGKYSIYLIDSKTNAKSNSLTFIVE